MSDEPKQKPIPLKEILAEKKDSPRTQGRIPVPVGVGKGLGAEIRSMHKPRYGVDNNEIDD